jgi:hypothetical protein
LELKRSVNVSENRKPEQRQWTVSENLVFPEKTPSDKQLRNSRFRLAGATHEVVITVELSVGLHVQISTPEMTRCGNAYCSLTGAVTKIRYILHWKCGSRLAARPESSSRFHLFYTGNAGRNRWRNRANQSEPDRETDDHKNREN